MKKMRKTRKKTTEDTEAEEMAEGGRIDATVEFYCIFEKINAR